YQSFIEKQEAVKEEMARLKKIRLKPTEELQAFLAERNSTRLKDGFLFSDLLKRPELDYNSLYPFAPLAKPLPSDVVRQVEIQVKYDGYINKAYSKVEKLKKLEAKRIPEDIDYAAINGIANE